MRFTEMKKRWMLLAVIPVLTCSIVCAKGNVAHADDGSAAGTHTCFSNGNVMFNDTVHWDQCGEPGCDKHLDEGEHFYDNASWKTVRQATATQDGLEERKCDYCDFRQQRVTSATGTTPGEQQTTDESASAQQTSQAEFRAQQEAQAVTVFRNNVINVIQNASSVSESGAQAARTIELGKNTAFDAEMINAMRGADGRSKAEFVFLVTIDGVRYRVVIPKGADLHGLPGDRENGDMVSRMIMASVSRVEGILYVAKVAGGTVTVMDGSGNGMDGSGSGMNNGQYDFGGRTGTGQNADGGAIPGNRIAHSVFVDNHANYGEAQRAIVANVQKTAPGGVLALHLGSTPTLSGGFFRAAADANGLTKTNLVIRYSLPGLNGGAVRQTEIPAGTDISVLAEAGKAEGILYLEQIAGCPGEVVASDGETEADGSGGFAEAEETNGTWGSSFGTLTLGHF